MKGLWKRPAVFVAVATAAMFLGRIHPWFPGGPHLW